MCATVSLVIASLITVVTCDEKLSMLGPSLVLEPESRVQYAATRGVSVRCAARGHPPPTISWIADDGTTLRDLPSVRRIHSNGTLEMLGTSGTYEVSAARVRCRVANPHGVALSREVTLQPVVDGGWDVMVSAGPVVVGGVAAVTCAATSQAGLVRPALWYRGDTVLHIDAPNPNSRHLLAGNTLLIRDVTPNDAGPYSCLARHTLTASTKRARPLHLTVISTSANSAPRLVSADGELSVPAGHDVCLPCVATDLKQPHYTWYREINGRLEPVGAESSGGWSWAGGAAQCLRRVTRASSGLWICKAYNVYGDATAHVTLNVQEPITVKVEPTVLVADAGSTARFTCSASQGGAALSWLHNGAPVATGAEVTLRAVSRAHRGVYQCVARQGAHSSQAAAELRLGESAPELHYTFIEQALRPGGGVSLRCAASASPPPRFSWLLDDQPLDQFRSQHRYFISSESSLTGDVVSVLNMSAVTAGDGGRYTCRAHNERGHVDHSARLNIYGPPSIRALGPMRVVAGANATIYCPYAGYPISSISWWRRGASVAVGASGRVSARGAELRLAPALAADAGHYACAVAAPQGPAARRDIDVQVRNPPKISPFMFSSELTEGSSVQVLCGVSSGDKPMYFSWLKDDAPLPANLQIEEKSLNEFSLLMFSELSARHSGAYTCRVSNHAATVNYTAHLSVKVVPSWTREPLDAAVLVGAPLLLECGAKGYPPPTVSWYKRIGEGGDAEGEGEQWERVRGMEWGEGGGAHNGTLSAGAAARSHQGLYRCVADNGVGPPLVKPVNITVHEPAHFEGGGGNVSCVRGRSASLACLALGDAPLDVHWTHRGVRLDLASYRWAVTEVRTGAGLRSTLTLRAAERADAGEYRCHAQNRYGRSEQLMYLHVDEPPEAPRRLLLGGVGSRWVRVSWTARVVPSPSVEVYTALYTPLHAPPGAQAPQNIVNLTLQTTNDDRMEADGSRTLTARLDGLRPAAAYSLRLIASNHVGQSPHSEPLLFSTLEEAPSASPQSVRVRTAGAGELHVSWTAPPQDNWNGELLGYAVSWRELSRLEEDEEGEEGARHSGSAAAAGWASAELALSGLRSGARFAVTVRAFNRAGAGPHSPAAYGSTADGVPELAPRSVSCEPLAPRSLRVRWTPLSARRALRGYDLHYAPVHLASSWSGDGAGQAQTARAGVGGEATLQGLRPATEYTVWVRARSDAGLGPPSPPVSCETTEDVPEAVVQIRAVGCGADAVRVTWLAPANTPRLTHYTLYTRELGKVGGEWAQRVDAAEVERSSGERLGGCEELYREVRGLRERTLYEFWVRAATAAGTGPPSRPVTAAPAPPVSARISSFGRVVYAAWGSRVRLRCAAVGAPPLRWRWSPLPSAHTVADTGDLIIHKAEVTSGGNYTCVVRNGGGSDALSVSLVVRLPPAAPVLRLVRADVTALSVAWDAPSDGGAALLGYTLQWSRGEGGERGEGDERTERSRRLPPTDTAHALVGLACGASYRVTLRAHNAVGASPYSTPLLTRTRGDKARAPPGKAPVWANSTVLRLNLLAWGGRCPVTSWSVALRPAAAHTWIELENDGETAQGNNLRPGSWYELRVVAHSPAGDTVALYRAATHTLNGERLGEAVEVPAEAHSVVTEGIGRGRADKAFWRTGLAPALFGGGLALLLVILTAVVLMRRRAAWCLQGECPLEPTPVTQPHPQLYTTEPKRNGKTLTPPDVSGELHEISPYATFSMSESAARAATCALHLRTFGRAEPLDLAAPPPRPNLLAHSASEYGRGRDSDSESSGSPCAACTAELYRSPAAHLSDTLPAVESSADDTSYSAGARSTHGAAVTSRQAARARRREHARHSSQPTVRYLPVAARGRAGSVARCD